MRYFLFWILLLSLFPVSAQQKISLATETQKDSILASVNGESITLQDVILESSPEESKLATLFQGLVWREYKKIAPLARGERRR